jgi:DNA polymerase-3 subunit delta'
MFESVLGQELQKRYLLSAFQRGHLPHALLFVGPEGVGKDAMAQELAKLLLCPAGKGDDDCHSCRRVAKIIHPDLQLIVPLPRTAGTSSDEPLGVKLRSSVEENLIEQMKEKAANPYHQIQLAEARFILIDQIRALKRMVSLKAFERGAKVYILSQAHAMTEDAQVSLLKILEEPPANTFIILTASTDAVLLSTIRSRCQQVVFSALPASVIEEALIARQGIDSKRAQMISKMSDGNYRRALTLLNDDSMLQRDEVLNFLRVSYSGKPAEIHNSVLKLTQQNSVSEIQEALRTMLSFLHDAWTLQLSESSDALAFREYRDTLVKFSKTASREHISQFIKLVEDAIADIRSNVIPSLVLLTLALEMHRLFRQKTSMQLRA